MLHTPNDIRTDIGTIMLSPGIKSRVAPHRLYVKMANYFCSFGIPVFRFDPEGLGDSEGEIEETLAADVYGSIQMGRFIDDTISAMDLMEDSLKINRFVLAGLCGGAITGLLAGCSDQRVEALIGLGIPVTLDSNKTDSRQYITDGHLNELRQKYFAKILDPKSWLRFFVFKSDYRIILKSVTLSSRNFLNGLKTNNSNSHNFKQKNSMDVENNTNPIFADSFFKFLSNKKILLFFSGRDRLYWDYDEKFVSLYRRQLNQVGQNLEVHITQDANHILSFTEWQDDMFDKLSVWLKNKFSVDSELLSN